MRSSSAWKALVLALLSLHCAHRDRPPEAPAGRDRVYWLEAPLEATILDLTADAHDVFAIGDFVGERRWGERRLVSQGRTDAFVGRFRPSGEVRWLRGLGGAGVDGGTAVTLSAEDSLVIVGNFVGRVDFGVATFQARGAGDCFVSKLSREDGRVHWGQSLGGPDGALACRSVASDAAGDLFITGQLKGDVTLGAERLQSAGMNDLFLLKLSGRDGTPLWARRFGGAGEDAGLDVAVSPSGTVLVTGFFSQRVTPEAGAIDFGTGNGALMSQGDGDGFLAAFASDDGHTQWARAFGGPTDDESSALVVTPEGDLYLTGRSRREEAPPAEADFEGFLAAFSSLGSERWRHRWPAMTSGRDLALTPGGELVLVGEFAGTLVLGPGVRLESEAKGDVLVAGFSTTGEALWAQRFGGPQNDYGYTVAATHDDVAAGGFISPDFVFE